MLYHRYMDDMHNIIPGLFLGSQEAGLDLISLQEKGVTHVLAVGSCLEMPYPQELKYHHIDLHDFRSSNLISHFHTCSKFIDEGIQAGGVLVHCQMGISRSSTVVIAYLMEKQKMTYLKALSHTQERRTFISPNEGFRKQLKLFEELNCVVDAQAEEKIRKLMQELIEF
eukprot:Phypoly_transcript_20684.p1 GENE.Phypoly_transcript_20684~~Phypoly_transcript_20684.p1  ORF type:complete len:169 (+),score=10.05 Phypoly_transcript_20684:116-622(+)